jgi:hypothetical protein
MTGALANDVPRRDNAKNTLGMAAARPTAQTMCRLRNPSAGYPVQYVVRSMKFPVIISIDKTAHELS